MDGGQRHSLWRRSQEPNFNGGAADTAPSQNRASPWHGVWHVADIGIDAMMLAPVTQCVLSMLSTVRPHDHHISCTRPSSRLLLAPGERRKQLLIHTAGCRHAHQHRSRRCDHTYIILDRRRCGRSPAALLLAHAGSTPGACCMDVVTREGRNVRRVELHCDRALLR